MTTTAQLIRDLTTRMDHLMADITALTNAVNQLTATDASVVTELQRLSALVANGGSVTQADLDALTAKVQGVSSDIDNAIAQDPS